jgi:hypothetical protein
MKTSFTCEPVRRYLPWFIFALLLYFQLRLFSRVLIDDSFIVLSYVKTLSASGTWGFFPGFIANSATSPLNVLLLTAVSLFTGQTPDAVLWLTLISHLCIAILLVRISNRMTGMDVFGWLGAFALVANPLLISAMGLESSLFVALSVLSIYSFLSEKWDMLAVSLGLLTLTRAEGGLFFLVFLPFIPETRRKMRISILYGLSIAPWYLFSWIYLGSALPDTLFIKTNLGPWGQWDFFNGLGRYLNTYPLETVLSFVFLPLAGFALINRRWRNTALLIVALAGAAHFIGYSVLRVPPYHWYYVPQVAAIIVLGSLGLGLGYRSADALGRRKTLDFIIAVYFTVPLLGMGYILARDGFSIREMPIHSNWATADEYKEIGLWLKSEIGDKSIRLEVGEIGTLAYYCDCYLLDEFSDRSWLEDEIHVHTRTGGLNGLFYEVNFKFFKAPQFPPDAYILRAYPEPSDPRIETIRKWEISTKWIPQGQIILYK